MVAFFHIFCRETSNKTFSGKLVLLLDLDCSDTLPLKQYTKTHNSSLSFQSYIKSSRWWSSREKIVEYPGYLPPGIIKNETITAIRIYDRHLNGNIGYANILSGGVGFNFVKIRLYSGGVGRGFNFLVQIFGH